MNTELVEKFVNGDITEPEFNAELDKLEPSAKEETKTLAFKRASEEKNKILSELPALRQERERIRRQSEEASKSSTPDFAKFRETQVKKATAKFFENFKIDDADKASYEEEFKNNDKGEVDTDEILESLKRIYAVRNVDKLLAGDTTVGARGAADFMSRQSNSASSSGGPSALKDEDPAVLKVLEAARREGISMTPEEAKRGLEAGIKKHGQWSGLKPLG